MYKAKQKILYIFLAFVTLLLTSVLAVAALFDNPKTVYAANAYYVKVTEAPSDWSGEYLIVYETGNVAFDGSLTTLDAASNNNAVTISNGQIEATDEMKAIQFTIAKSGSSYTIQSKSGYYIGNTANSNKLNSSTSTQYTNTITLNDDGSAHIVGSGGSILRYNAASGNYRFRYFKSSSYTNQKAIYLYKLTETAACAHSEYEWVCTDGTHIEQCKECGEPKADTVAEACTFDSYTYTDNGDDTHTKKGTCTVCATESVVSANETCSVSTWSDFAPTANEGEHSRTGNCTLCGATITETGTCEITAEYVREGAQHTQTGTCSICNDSTSVTEDCTLTIDGYEARNTDDGAAQQHTVTTTCSVCEKSATANEVCSFDSGVLNGTTLTYTCEHCAYSYTEEVTTYTVTYVVPDAVTTPEAVTVADGFTTSLPEIDAFENYTFVGWTTEELPEKTEESPEYLTAGNVYTVTEDVTFYALYSYAEDSSTWTLVTDASTLAVGKEIVIVASGSNYALGTTQNTNNRAAVSITKDGDTVTINNDVQIITLEVGNKADTFAFNVGNGYLYAASSGSNHLKTKAELDKHGSWKIAISSGVTTITAPESSNRNLWRYNPNNSNPIFSCYGSTSTTGESVSIYMKDSTTYYVTASNTCQHTNTEEDYQAATCTEDGYRTLTCLDCETVLETEVLTATGHTEVENIVTPATCTAVGSKTITCENCAELNETVELPIIPHNYENGSCTICGNEISPVATLTFDDTAKRTSFSTEEQVWTENSVILTHSKADSSTPIADYTSPVRFYKNSTITIAYPQMVKIIFACNSASYATALQTAIGNTATANGKIVTVKFAEPVDSFTVTLSADQVRMDSLTVISTSAPDINSASVTLGEDITLNYYVTIPEEIFSDTTLVFTLNGENLDVAGVVQQDGRYKFSLELPPQYMADNVQAVLSYNGVIVDQIDNYSIKAYAESQLSTASNELKQLISDMLHYGAAAQIYKEYNVENLANANVEGILDASTATPEATDFLLTNNEEVDSYPAYFAGAGVHFDNVNKLYVKLSTTENVTLTVNEVAVKITGTTFYTDGIQVTNFDETYTFVLSHGGVVMQTLTYSVNAYAYAMKDNATMQDLALALYRYGVSAEAYQESLNA